MILKYYFINFENSVTIYFDMGIIYMCKLYRRVYMEAINLILFGFIVYTALIVVPSIWEELTTES